MSKKQFKLPLVTLRGMVVFPEMVVHFDVSRKTSVAAVHKAMEAEEQIFLVAQKEAQQENPGQEDLFEVGTVASIKQIINVSPSVTRVLAVGQYRGHLNSMLLKNDYFEGEIEEIQILEESLCPDEKGKIQVLKDLFQEHSIKEGKVTKELFDEIIKADKLSNLIDQIAGNSLFPFEEMQKLLAETDVNHRFELLAMLMQNGIKVLDIKEEIASKVRDNLEKNQRDYVLREQLHVIREELGDSTTISEGEEYLKATEALQATEEVKSKLRKECKRFQGSMNSHAENGLIRTYIETMLEMPWDKTGPEHYSMAEARQILDKEHYGLRAVKDRILEYLAVRILNQGGDPPIICLVGPPGTGKTSIAQSLAKAMEKTMVRISLGGVRDEAEIRGHRKTYIGAMPGRIVNGLRTAGVKNPLMLLDEIDKVGGTNQKGDTFSALLEVLDSEQNHKFRDHYLEVPVDLSQVTFLATANTLQDIPKPLVDRMEVIEVHSYTDNEKMHIARRHLVQKQLNKHGMSQKLTISKGALSKLIRNYTKEAGVRQLERKIGEICRKAAIEILEQKREKIQVTERNLSKYLGKEIFRTQMANLEDEIGIVRGLAWTSVGGDTLQIEVNLMPGKGEVLLTGQLGNVMKESAMTGISYIRSIAKKYNIEDAFFEKHDIHIHIPEGAVPKDGPSAGITMATAMLSAITERKVYASVAMTGEITLRGRVLPIGGLKEKLLAAKNAGIKTVLIPKDNKRDVDDISTEITEQMNIIPVSTLEEVLEVALKQS